MSANLEKILQKNRNNLDVETPDDQLIWEGIRTGLHTDHRHATKRPLFIRIRNMAAVILIVLSMGYVMIDLFGDRKDGKGISLEMIDKDLGARELEYIALVSFKQKEAGSTNLLDNAIIAELFEEIQKLDTIYQQSMKDLGELGYNEQVINTIFDTYEKKIYLLELIILENNKIRIHETDQNQFL